MSYFTIRSNRRNQGFTLVEAMITVIVLAILATIGVPSYTTLTRNHRMTSQANDLLMMARRARSEAVKDKEEVNLVVDTVGTGWRARVIRVGETEPLRIVDHSSSSVTLTCNPCTAIFTSYGTVDGTGLPFTWRLVHNPCDDARQAREITIFRSGQTSINNIECPSS